jgi:hypothetical protein
MNDPADHAPIVNPMGPRQPRGSKGSIRHSRAPLRGTAESSAQGGCTFSRRAAPNWEESYANANANMAAGLVASDPAATDQKAKISPATETRKSNIKLEFT